MIYTVPWAPVIALSVVFLLFLAVPLVAFAALATMLLALALSLLAAAVGAAVVVPPLVLAAARRGLTRLGLVLPRPRVAARRPAALVDPRLDRIR